MRMLTAQGEVSVDHVDGSLPSVPVGPGAEHFTRAAKCQNVEQTAQENIRPIHNWPAYASARCCGTTEIGMAMSLPLS